ncbi:MAG TPA: DsrE family protein [Burkholderiales bacterium]|nr:DsrE family protein [Burkholderiales bacterium]
MRFVLAAALLGAALAGPALAQDKPQRLLIQISDESPKVWGLALSNARNVRHDLGPDKVQIEIVVYGPAIRMLEAESDWRDRVTEVLDESIRVIACENSMATLGLKRDDMLGGVDFVKTGLAHIMKRELEGWAYVRP